MKNLKYIVIVLFVTMFSCDESTDPNDFFDEDSNGAWLRTIALNANLNLNDINSAQFEVTLEEVDEEGGNLLSKVDVYASFIDNTVEGSDLSVAEVFYVTFDGSEFDTSTGRPRITQIITANEISSFMSLDPTDLAATDIFVFRYELFLTDGRVYSTINSGTNIEDTTNPFYVSPFQYNAPLVCPVADTYAVGTYAVTTTIGGAFGSSFNETVELTVGSSPTKRAFNGDWINFGNIATWQFDLVCGNVIFDDGQSTGLACSLGITLSSGETSTTYDENDDSVILINFTENDAGDCGAPTTQNQIMLTKQ